MKLDQKTPNPNPNIARLPNIVKTFNLDSFNTYILNSKENIKEIEKQIRETQGQVQTVRFNLWRLLTGVIQPNQTTEQKLDSIQRYRYHYKELVGKFIKNEDIVTKAPIKRDPLSKDTGSGQSTNYFENHELKNQIKIDIERTYQEIPFFSNPRVRTILTNSLFLWAKENTSISYIQGMNEVAASVVYIYFQECLGEDTIDLQGDSENGKIALNFNDVNYAEADVYALLKHILNDAQHMEMFRPNYTEKQKIAMNSKKPSPILNRIAKIQDLQLKIVDIDLFRHLKLLDVELRVFLLRWLRCMFTREFPLLDSFMLWDAIFLEYFLEPKDNNLHLVDCMALAMMSVVRGQVLEQEESSQCYQKFLKFPVLKDLKTLIDVAFHYKTLLNDPNAKEIMDSNVPVLIPKIESDPLKKPTSSPTHPMQHFTTSPSPQPVKNTLPVKNQTNQIKNTPPVQSQTIKPQIIHNPSPPPPQKNEAQIRVKEEKIILTIPATKAEPQTKPQQIPQEIMIKFNLDDVQIIINALTDGVKNLKSINRQELTQTVQDMEEIKMMMEAEVEKQTKQSQLFGFQR